MKKTMFGILVLVMCVGCKTETVSNTTVNISADTADKIIAPVNMGKPGAAISLLNNAQEIPVGVDTTIDLALMTPIDAGQLTASISTSTDLMQTAGIVEHNFRLGSKAGALNLPIDVNASIPGKHYINIQAVITDSAGVSTARSLAMIVWAGEGAKKQADAAIKASSQSAPDVKVLQAVETIKTTP